MNKIRTKRKGKAPAQPTQEDYTLPVLLSAAGKIIFSHKAALTVKPFETTAAKKERLKSTPRHKDQIEIWTAILTHLQELNEFRANREFMNKMTELSNKEMSK